MISTRSLAELHSLPPDALVTPDEAELMTRINRATLANWRCSRTGPSFVRAGRRVLYRKRALDDFLARAAVETVRTGAAA
jgi:hypothetical protein